MGKFNSDWVDRNTFYGEFVEEIDGKSVPHFKPYERPLIVCLVGSTRFKQQYIKTNFEQTMLGKIVLSVGLYSHADKEVYSPTEEEKQKLDWLHLRKIELADEVFVINPLCFICSSCGRISVSRGDIEQMCRCGAYLENATVIPYIGESTKREIEHAQKLHKTMLWLTPPNDSNGSDEPTQTSQESQADNA